MLTRTIGSLQVSVVGLGCNTFGAKIDEAATAQVVAAALDAGITLFDTADVYGGDQRSEELLGRALGRRRDEVVVATKFGMPLDRDRRGAHPRYVRHACEASLRRLGTDRIDLYQLHKPDPDVPVAETMGALGELVAEGKVREIGHSNMSPSGVEEADRLAACGGLARFVCAQERWNLLDRGIEDELLPAIERAGLAVLPYYPLAGGLLTGKYRPGEPPEPAWRIAAFPAERRAHELADERMAHVARLEAYAADHGRSLLELAVSWLIAQRRVASVIAGARRPEQVAANVAAADWHLGPDDLADMERLNGADGPHRAGCAARDAGPGDR